MKQEFVQGSLIAKAHELIARVVNSGDVVVDATLGNGHDTLFLAQLVGSRGKVIGFDVQQEAIDATHKRLSEADVDDDARELNLINHSRLDDYVPDGVSAVMFNLGYLPGGDKSKITQVDSTLKALSSSLALLKDAGILTVMCYPGHAGGDHEAEAVKRWFEDHSTQGYRARIFQREAASETTPFLLILGES